MNSVAILNTGGKENINVKNYIESEFLKNEINIIQPISVETIKKSDSVILMYDTNEGITTGFEEMAENLITWNIKPIILVTNAQNPNVDYVKVDEEISITWRNLNSELLNTITRFYYENDKQIAYQVRTGEEQGISELIDHIKSLKYKMKFFE